jgi:hypothetical protein
LQTTTKVANNNKGCKTAKQIALHRPAGSNRRHVEWLYLGLSGTKICKVISPKTSGY